MEFLSLEFIDSILLMGTTLFVISFFFVSCMNAGLPFLLNRHDENDADHKPIIKRIYELGFIPQIIWNLRVRTFIRKDSPDNEDGTFLVIS